MGRSKESQRRHEAKGRCEPGEVTLHATYAFMEHHLVRISSSFAAYASNFLSLPQDSFKILLATLCPPSEQGRPIDRLLVAEIPDELASLNLEEFANYLEVSCIAVCPLSSFITWHAPSQVHRVSGSSMACVVTLRHAMLFSRNIM